MYEYIIKTNFLSKISSTGISEKFTNKNFNPNEKNTIKSKNIISFW